MFDKLRKIIPDLSKAKVIEGIIDPETHLEYIEFSAKIGKKISDEKVIEDADKIFSDEFDLEDKKELLVLMAKIDDVNIFRKIQKYSEKPDEGLSDWAFIALQESQNLIQSSLLGEEQILISTGLGGKDNKLRFFIIAQTENNEIISEIQKKIIQKEIEFAFNNNDCIVEKLEFGDNFYTIVGLFPFNFDVIEITLRQILEELKNFNINISEKYIITNIKVSNLEQSAKLIREMDQKSKSNEIDGNEFDNDLFDFDVDDFDDFLDDDEDDDEDDFDDENEDDEDDLF